MGYALHLRKELRIYQYEDTHASICKYLGFIRQFFQNIYLRNSLVYNIQISPIKVYNSIPTTWTAIMSLMSTEKTEFHLFTLKQEEEKKSTSPQAPKERYFSLSKDILKKEKKKKNTKEEWRIIIGTWIYNIRKMAALQTPHWKSSSF